MNRFSLHLSCTLLTVLALTVTARADDTNLQYYEVRSYILGENGDADAIDQYLRQALVPALKRQDVGPIGVFGNAPSDESGSARIVVVIPYANSAHIREISQLVEADGQYQAAAKKYLDRNMQQPAYQRISSELLVAMKCMPALNVSKDLLDNADRVYELRLYESANERLGNLKVDMFNNGEVPIFLDCGIQPVFIGQCVIGPQTPSLTYLTVYQNDAARSKAWVAFRKHPDWHVLKEVEKYKGTVSHIDKFILSAKPYSQM